MVAKRRHSRHILRQYNYDDTAQDADDADLLEWYHDAMDVAIWAAGMCSACGEYPVQKKCSDQHLCED